MAASVAAAAGIVAVWVTYGTAAGAVAFAVVTLVVWSRFGHDEQRLFSWQQKAVMARIAGPECVWRPVHMPQAIAAAWVASATRGMPADTGAWIVVATLAVLAGTGLPTTRTAGWRCRGPIVGDHERPHSVGGKTKITNLSLACRVHNGDKSDSGAWSYAARQWFVWSLGIYLARWSRQWVLLRWNTTLVWVGKRMDRSAA